MSSEVIRGHRRSSSAKKASYRASARSTSRERSVCKEYLGCSCPFRCASQFVTDVSMASPSQPGRRRGGATLEVNTRGVPACNASYLMREAIGGHQRSLEVSSVPACNASYMLRRSGVSPRGSTANRDDASNLVAFSASYWAPMWLLNSSVSPVRHTIRGHQWSSAVISGHQWSSVRHTISGHQWSSHAIRSQSDGNPRQSPGRSYSLITRQSDRNPKAIRGSHLGDHTP